MHSIPPFMLCSDSSDDTKIFVLHNADPRFLLDVAEEQVVWLDETAADFFETEKEEEIQEALLPTVAKAFEYFDAEMAKWEEEDEEA